MNCLRLAVGVAFAVIGSVGVSAALQREMLTACPSNDELLQMARDGNSSAQLVVGKRYLRGAEADVAPGVEWLLRAAEEGNASAQTLLGIMYMDGIKVPKNPFDAGFWFLRAAEQGNTEAQSRLGLMYTDGIGVPKDLAEASQWLYRSSSSDVKTRIALQAAVNPLPFRALRATMSEYQIYAEQGSSLAQYTLGRMYFDAPFGQRNEQMAVEWLKKAATRGHVRAAIDLAEILALGSGVIADEEQAVEWFRNAAKHDRNRSAQAVLQVSRKFDTGRGVTLNEEKIFFWVTLAAELGNARAQNELGRMYAKGLGIQADAPKSVLWYLRAAKQDIPAAQYALAEMYVEGNGVAVDVGEAYFWWSLSARKGYVGGKLNAAGYWDERLGGEHKVIDEAVRHWRPDISGALPANSQQLETVCNSR